jgi:adenylate kinase family enzyme
VIEKRGLGGRPCVHFDFGSNLRRLAQEPGEAGFLTDGDLISIRRALATGSLFEDADMPMIIRIVERFTRKRGLEPGSLLVLNGLPRHREQAEGLAGIVAVERIVLLEADAAVVRDRIRINLGGDRLGRTDDAIEEVDKRLAGYREQTRPLLGFYRERGVPILVIQVTGTMSAAEMYATISRKIGRGQGVP